MKVLYTASVMASGGRDGKVRSSDGALDLRLATPKEMGGGGQGTNPEQLFAAGYAACFQTAVRHLATQRGLTISDSSVDAEVALGPRAKGGFGLKVNLKVKLQGIARAEAQSLIDLAHNEVCPYSNAVRGNIDVAVQLM